MLGEVTRHMLPHLPGVPGLLVNRPLTFFIVILHFSRTDFLPDQKLSEGLQDLLRGYDLRIRPNYSGIT